MKRFLLLIITKILRLDALKAKALSYILAGAVILVAAFSLWLFSQPNAFATGGAFRDTKHGGGTVDGIVFSGVDRGVNPDYGLYYNSLSPDAGQYAPGECNHCHELHASFGGSEPEPAAGSTADQVPSPNPYLGMADTNQEFCWYCHENINFDPFYGGGTGYWKFYQGKSRYQASGHYNNTNMKNPGYGAGSVWPRTNRTSNLLAGHCLNCHTTHGIKEPSASPYDTTAVPTAGTNKHLAVNNPSVSADYLIPRQLIAWEEALCENCHKATGEGGIAAAKDIRTYLGKLEGLYGTFGSGHPVHNVNQSGGATTPFSGRHSLNDEENPTVGSWNSYAANRRHVECYDCHNPHVAKTGSSGPNMFRRSGESATGRDVTIGPVQMLTPDGYGGANSGVWGVNVDISAGTIISRANEATYLYQLCLKCHSAYADSTLTTQQGYSGPQAPSWINRSRWDGINYTHFGGDDTMYLTDVAKDFARDNPAPVGNAPFKGYHPVFALGRNNPPVNANPRWGVLTYSSRPTGVLAADGSFKNNFVPPWGPNAYVTCVDCHEDSSETTPRGPHGSDRPFILRKLDGGIQYTVLNRGDGSAEIVSYSSFQYGYVSGSTYGSYGPVNLATYDPNNLCLNCHRADVYGFFTQDTGGCGVNSHREDESVWPRYRDLSRQPHPVEGENGKGYSFTGLSSCGGHDGAGWPPRGIVCLRCHGGGSVGGIHGNLGNINGHDNGVDDPGSDTSTLYRYDTSIFKPSSNRLLNGTDWSGVKFGRTASRGGCFKGNENLPFNFNACTHSGGPTEFGKDATYDY